MDFKLTDEQELIVDSYREYMESENWETYFHECDEKHEYPLRWVKGLCELGFDQIMLPESHGGLGLEQPCVTLMAVYEILGKYGAPTYVLYQLPGFETIIREGTEEHAGLRRADLELGLHRAGRRFRRGRAGHHLQARERQDLPQRH